MSSSDNSYSSPYGFALRRDGTCHSNETSCAKTWADWYACCPGEAQCTGGESNWVCCPTDGDCTGRLELNPHCGLNQTWSMFDKEGYFCCLEGQTGFYNKSNPGLVGVGCSDGPPSGEGVVTLNLKTQAPQSSSSSAPTSNDSSDHTGAIVGGVVGGVVGLAAIAALLWFFTWRRRQQNQPPVYASHPPPSWPANGGFQPGMVQQDFQGIKNDNMAPQNYTYPAEMEHSERPPAELPSGGYR